MDCAPYLKQCRWRCTLRDAFYGCCCSCPWAHTKMPKIQQVLDHYDAQIMNGKVVDLQEYKRAMSLE